MYKDIVASWNTLPLDDRLGYLQDFVETYAKENNITKVEDVFNNDLAAKEFMIQVLAAVGIFDEEQ